MFVEYEEVSISAVLKFLRASEFDVGLKRGRSTHLPKGIHVRGDGYSVVYTKPDGSTSQKLCRELDDALAFHADPTIAIKDNDDSSDNGEASAPQVGDEL